MTEARTVDGVLRHWAHRFPGKDAVVDPDTRLSYADLDASTRRIAAVPRGATGKVDVARLRELLTPAPSVDL